MDMKDIKNIKKNKSSNNFCKLSESAEQSLDKFSDKMNLDKQESAEIKDVVFNLFSEMEEEITAIKKRNLSLEEENGKLKMLMEEYRDRLEKISKSKVYKIYSFFKNIFKEKKK